VLRHLRAHRAPARSAAQRGERAATRRACLTSICCSSGGGRLGQFPPDRAASAHARTRLRAAPLSTSALRQRSPVAAPPNVACAACAASASTARDRLLALRSRRQPWISKVRYVVGEGRFGAGKTSLAARLPIPRRRMRCSKAPEELRFSRGSTRHARFALPTQLNSVSAGRPRSAGSTSSTCSARHRPDFLLDKDPLFGG